MSRTQVNPTLWIMRPRVFVLFHDHRFARKAGFFMPKFMKFPAPITITLAVAR